MAIYLNTNRNLENYKELYNEEYFVDKSEIISLINKKINTKSKYICITRPRRFGKSSIASMLGAYYSKAVNSKEIFDELNISSSKSYIENLNKYNVISISFTEVDKNCKSCSEYIDRITDLLIQDLKEVFPNIKIKENYAIWDILNELNEKFIFIFDEWDYIFNSNLFKEDQNEFLSFLLLPVLKPVWLFPVLHITFQVLYCPSYDVPCTVERIPEYGISNSFLFCGFAICFPE